jgi:transposase
MKRKRLTVRKINEIFRLHFVGKLSNRQIASSLQISKTTVRDCLGRFAQSGLTWPLAVDFGEDALYGKLYPGVPMREGKPLPDWEHIRKEMSRPHVTLQLLWAEYRQTFPDGVGRSQFYEHYQEYCGRSLSPVMRMVHKGGEKLFVDFSGDGLAYIDQPSGEVVEVELFVASWGASSFCYAEAVENQTIRCWIRVHRHAFRYFGCIASLLVPDNLKSGVTAADYYEPDLNPTYAQMAAYYGAAVLPARPDKPRDKAVVESNVLHIQRYILARLRDQKFFSLAEINAAILVELEQFNDKPMQEYGVSRRQRFTELDKPFALPLPAEDFPYNIIKIEVYVNLDYHIEYREHYYSVPHHLCKERVEVRETDRVVEVYYKNERVASHPFSLGRYGHTTCDAHMPENHRFVKGWSPGYFLNRGLTIGSKTVEAIQQLLARHRHPEIAYRSIMGVLSLQKQYPKERIEKAAERAIYFNQVSKYCMRQILEQGLDKEPLVPAPTAGRPSQLVLFHENIRGADYYATSDSQMEVV